MRTTYWGVLADGSLRIFERPPKRKYVIEVCSDVSVGVTHHVFTCAGVSLELTAGCGYDRGPKRQAIIRKMLSN